MIIYNSTMCNCKGKLLAFEIEGTQSAIFSYIHMTNVWLYQVKSDSNLLIAEFETYFLFMQNLGLIPKSTSCYCKDSKPLVTFSRQKRAHTETVPLFCVPSIQVCSGTAEHNCPKDDLPKLLTHVWQHCLQTPIQGGTGSTIPISINFLIFWSLLELAAVSRLLTASKLGDSRKTSISSLHSPMSSGICENLGKICTPFLWSWVFLHLRKGL